MGAEQNIGQQVAEAFWVSLTICSLLGLWIYLGTPENDGEPTRWERFRAWFTNRYAVSNMSSVYVTPVDNIEADEQTDEQTDLRLSVLEAAVTAKQIDVIRDLLIDTLVCAGADVDTVRQSVKGDGGVIGTKVADARQRLGISLPSRKLTVSDNGKKREIAF